jgi:pilus assembly protein CpaF
LEATLRLNPDRLIMGEIRGGESYDFVDLLNTGHSGSFCTLHANSAADGIHRLESMYLSGLKSGMLSAANDARERIARSIHYAIFIDCSSDVRRLTEIVQLLGLDTNGRYLFRYLLRDGKSVGE